MFERNSISDSIRNESEVAKPKRDPMRLAYQYQDLLDSKVVTTRAELARHLGVSRARVTQVLNRLAQFVGTHATSEQEIIRYWNGFRAIHTPTGRPARRVAGRCVE